MSCPQSPRTGKPNADSDQKRLWYVSPSGRVLPGVIQGAHTGPLIRQYGFRCRLDGVTLASTSWTYAEDADPTIDVNTVFRWRVGVENYGDTTDSTADWKAQYNLASGGWNDVSATSPLQWASSGNYANLDAITTAQLTSQSASSFGGEAIGVEGTNAINTSNMPADQYEEYEMALSIDSAQVSNGQTVLLRLVMAAGTVFDDYGTADANIPVITINEVGGATTRRYSLPLTGVG